MTRKEPRVIENAGRSMGRRDSVRDPDVIPSLFVFQLTAREKRGERGNYPDFQSSGTF